MFKTHINNLAGIKAAATYYGIIFFHGDGNIYHNEADSEFRRDFSNDKNGPETYRVKYRLGDKFPETLEELHVDLLASKTKEMQDAQLPQSVAGISTFKVEFTEEVKTAVVTDPVTGLPVVDTASLENGETKTGKGK